ncbi:MAG: IscS subfamily cysteine desulfurase, partial [Alphaproteobacteria bacterium]|nr:IscS subfamily cysteine desulfurase [Alphaproteobacteria bacterium]
RLRVGVPSLTVNGAMSARIAGNLNLTLPRIDAEALLLEMPNIAISTGSACASGTSGPSPVLAGLGLGPDEAARGLRMCLGRFTSEDEVEEAADTIISAWSRLAASQSPA